MKKVFIIFLFLLLLSSARAQYNYHHPSIFYYPPVGLGTDPDIDVAADGSYNPGLFSWYLNSGFSFMSLNGLNAMTSWISPKALLPVRSNLVMEVGATFMTTSFPGSGTEGANRYNDIIAYARGIYGVNEKLTIYGEAEKSIIANPQYGSGYQNITLGMEYFLTPHLRFGASITSVRYPESWLNMPYSGAYWHRY